MTLFQITFVWPNDDWTWIDVEANDFHQSMLIALDKCPATCRVQRIERLQEGNFRSFAYRAKGTGQAQIAPLWPA
jgi:hypothetical protein